RATRGEVAVRATHPRPGPADHLGRPRRQAPLSVRALAIDDTARAHAERRQRAAKADVRFALRVAQALLAELLLPRWHALRGDRAHGRERVAEAAHLAGAARGCLGVAATAGVRHKRIARQERRTRDA